MKKYIIFIVAIILIVALAYGGYYYIKRRNNRNQNTPLTSSQSSTAPDQSSSTTQPAMSTPPAETPAPTLVYPLPNFASRITKNTFGQYFPAGGTTNPDREVCPNATYYTGYHTADDLETFSNETGVAVPVKSIAVGTVKEVRAVSGYGGLIVIEYNLGGNIYTAYFGHINLEAATVKAGDHVAAGEHIVDLGPQCSSANGNVRKHLHFGLHKGSAIDVRGYVPSQSVLSSWADPKVLLTNLGAQ